MFFKLEGTDFKDKKVLVRVDFNVPLDDSGKVANDKRIKAALPTIRHLLDNGVKQIILMSHLGRPKGEVVEKLKMDKIAHKLEELLDEKVVKVDDCVDIEIPDEKIVVLENLRFHKEEKKNDAGFAKKLAKFADIYVNDAFGTCHREHASVAGVTKYIPSCVGFLVQKELEVMGKAVSNAEHPFAAVLGGAKVSDKIELISNLLNICDKILIGGAMMFTFLKSKGVDVGGSKVEEDKVGVAENLLKLGKGKLVLPVDTVAASKFESDAESREVGVDEIPSGWLGLDIGSKTIDLFKKELKGAKTVLWNGPMGVFEFEKFAMGTNEIAKFLAGLDAVTIIGGGDSAAAVEKLGLEADMTHVSTGGGASLEFFEGKKLPGVKALEDNYKQFHKHDKISLGEYLSPLHEPVRRRG